MRRRHIKRTLEALVALDESEDVCMGTPAPIDGRWELVYSTAEAFRCDRHHCASAHSSFKAEQLLGYFAGMAVVFRLSPWLVHGW